MSTSMPPVPPANRSHKGPGSDPVVQQDTAPKSKPPENPAQQDQETNTRQNTTHQGGRQDR